MRTGGAGARVKTDLLVIGSGFAGLWAAITARERGVADIAIVDKGSIGINSQSTMAAGATIYCLPRHDAGLWLKEMAAAHGYLSRQDIVADMLETSYSRLKKLESWGIEYLRAPIRGYVTLPSRGFEHVRMLVLPRRGGRKGGHALVGTLLDRVKSREGTGSAVGLYPRVMITALLAGGGRAAGAVGVDRRTGEPVVFSARAVLLAASDCSFRGGYACVDAVTGDAFRLAYDAGVRLNNMEFLSVNTGSPRYGFEGTGIAARFGRFLTRDLEPFMREYHPDADAAEVCHVVQAMAREVSKGSGPPFYFDMSRRPGGLITRKALESVGNMVELNLRRLEEEGVPVFRSPQEWLPVVQSLRGGVRTDIDCMSDLPGLFAAGTSQAVDPGLFNGWSSMRAMWSGERSGIAAAAYLRDADEVGPGREEAGELLERALEPLGRESGVTPDDVCARLQRALFACDVCVRKSGERLEEALAEVERLRDDLVPALRAAGPHELVKAHETANMVAVAELFLRASLGRRETRGDHNRADFPATDNRNWLAWINISRGPDGTPLLERETVPLSAYPFKPECA